ncbi:MAG: FG-GAP-like repeat-containing protein, partial [Marinirhabdus sp.]
MADKLHFGLGSAQQLDSLWVQWQDGNTQLYTNVAVNKTHTLSYSTNNTPPPLAGIYKKTAPLLKEVTAAVGMDHVHKENDHNDFETEILIPHKMSTLGPGMAVADVNGDGMDDFYIGGAKGFAGAMYTQQPNGKFKKTNSPLWAADRHSEDMAALFFDADSDGDTDLYVVSGGNEVPLSSPLLQDRLYRNDGSGNFLKAKGALPPMPASGSTVAAADYDNDGDTDLFVGGRGIPGSYPKPSRSYLLKNENGTFTDVTQTAAPQLTYPGIVTTAIWNDYNNDNKTDLILSGEWMPITVFQNNGGSFSDRTGALGLSRTTGWWYSLAAGDFDGDGDDDLMAGNLGDNYKYQTSPQKTFDLYYDDFDGNATGDIVLSYKENGKQVPLRGRECSSQQMPFIKEKFGTYDAFAKAGLVDVFGEEKLNGAMHLQAKTFSSTYIENTGNGTFNTKKLPRLAQLSSLNGILVKDVNADGFLDAIVSGNLYGSEVETTRND